MNGITYLVLWYRVGDCGGSVRGMHVCNTLFAAEELISDKRAAGYRKHGGVRAVRRRPTAAELADARRQPSLFGGDVNG